MIPSNIKALILDMDGVIWRGDAPIGDLVYTFKRIRERGLKSSLQQTMAPNHLKNIKRNWQASAWTSKRGRWLLLLWELHSCWPLR